MKTKCPLCEKIQKIPNIYQKKRIKCINCKEEFSPKNYNFLVKLKDINIKGILPFLGIALLAIYPFVASPYSKESLIFLRYLIVILSLFSLTFFIKKALLKKFPSIKKPVIIFSFLMPIFLIFLYAKNDYRMEYRIEGDTQYYDKFILWGNHLIYRSMYSHDPNNHYAIPSWSMEGPMSSRPNTDDYPKMHGMWENNIWGSDGFLHRYEWYWYGEEISEHEWIIRLKK